MNIQLANSIAASPSPVVRRRPRLRPLSVAGAAVCLVHVLVACQKSEPQPLAPSSQAALTTTAPTAVHSPAPPSDAPTSGNEREHSSAAAPALEPAAPPKVPWALATASGAPKPPPTEPDAPAAAASDGKSTITGCLAEAARPASRSGPPQATSAAAPLPAEPWRVVALRNEVVVTHHLEHACCLKGHAVASVVGQRMTIEEQLTGQACRCVCTSTIETRVQVPSGSYEVETVTVTNGQRQVVHSGHVAVALSKRR